MKQFKDLILSRLPFYRWHPEVAVRYLPIVKHLGEQNYSSVLEVGSGGLGIAPYLGRPVTGLDNKFSPPIHPLLIPKIGSGTKLPFPDKSFDVVLSVDTLEHIPPKSRSKVILEMLRVAKKEVVMATPTGQESSFQDQMLANEYKKINQEAYHFFSEHEKFGLPEEEDIKGWLGDNVTVEKNEPLKLRRFLVHGWMFKNLPAKIFYWKILLLFIPFFKLVDQPPYYRTIFYKKI